MNLSLARQLAQQGLSMKDAAKKLGVSPLWGGARTRRPED